MYVKFGVRVQNRNKHFHLYEKFRQECELRGLEYYEGWSSFHEGRTRYNGMLFSKNFVDKKGVPAFSFTNIESTTKVFDLETEWVEALLAVEEFIDYKPRYEVGEKVVIASTNTGITRFEGAEGIISEIDLTYRCPYQVNSKACNGKVWSTIDRKETLKLKYKDQITMTTITLTRKELKSLHSLACNKWKEEIAKKLREADMFDDSIEVDTSLMKRAWKAATLEQQEQIKKIVSGIEKLVVETYPRLMSHGNMVVLFSADEEGTVVQAGDYPLGHFSRAWNMKCFTDYNQPVTINL